MKSPLSLRAGLAGLALLAGAVALPAQPTAAAIEGTVDIRVELDLPYPDNESVGPRVFEVTGVTPGPGPELSEDDEIDNPSGWGGGVFVDIDPDTSLITISPDDAWDFQTATVTITASGITGLFTVLDDLWDDEDPPMPPVTTEVTASGVVIAWDNEGAQGSINMKEDGAAVFRYFTGTLAVAPTEVAAGEIATISGDDCATGSVEVAVGEGGAISVTPAADGTWSTEIDTTDLLGEIPVTATCVFGDTGFEYPAASFTVTAAETTTTTTSVPDEETTTTTTSVPDEETTTTAPASAAPASAAPASPVRATPTYTG